MQVLSGVQSSDLLARQDGDLTSSKTTDTTDQLQAFK